MPFCVQCGAQLQEGDKFCTVCGAKQPTTSAPSYVPPTEEKTTDTRGYSYAAPSFGAGQQGRSSYDPTIYSGVPGGGGQTPQKKKGGVIAGGVIALIILAAVVVLGALGFLIYSLTSGGKAPADDPVLGLYTAQKAEKIGRAHV